MKLVRILLQCAVVSIAGKLCCNGKTCNNRSPCSFQGTNQLRLVVIAFKFTVYRLKQATFVFFRAKIKRNAAFFSLCCPLVFS